MIPLATLGQGLKLAETVAGFLGGRSAAKAQALQMQAMVQLLKGVNEGLQDISQTLQAIFQQIDALPDAIKRILLELRDDQSRVLIVTEYQHFLGAKEHLLNSPVDGAEPDQIADYDTMLDTWLDRIRSASARVRGLDRVERVEPILIVCMALRAELDISNERLGLGKTDLNLGSSLASYIRYFRTLLDAEAKGSLPRQQKALEERRTALLSKDEPSVGSFMSQLLHDSKVEYLITESPELREPSGIRRMGDFFHVRVSRHQVKRVQATADEDVVVIETETKTCEGLMGGTGSIAPCRALQSTPNSRHTTDDEVAQFKDAGGVRLEVAIRLSSVRATIGACEAALELAEAALRPVNAWRVLQGGTEIEVD